MKKIAAITMVRNDDFYLKHWTRYYGAELGEENLYIYLDGKDQKLPDWSRKTAAKQLLEMALREKQETELLRKNFRGVFGEELEECRFGIIAVYGKTEENICSQIQEKYKGIRYISKTERISILLLAGYLSVKDTAFQIWNDLKEDAPRAVGWCSGA